MRNQWIAVLMTVAVPFLFTLSCSAQTPKSKELTYEVVSVKKSKGDPNSSNLSVRRDILSADTVLPRLIQYAFGLPWGDQVSGLPKWAESTRFDVEAKMDEDTMAALDKLPAEERQAKRREMCAQILTERFGLKFHHEVKVLPVYHLVIAKGGATLKRTESKSPGSQTSMDRAKLVGTGMTTADIATTLSRKVDRHILDKTGLTGRYDLELKWAADDDEDLQSIDQQATIITALREQLGLKLLPSKDSVEIIVVDAVSQPSEN
ncbi:TIGR03435 family protein [Terracidiphilus sp.]|jgi:uncharacterized protein (TIGR03435 family)|uniref:TIGR03435 family protein n=1 Tax=Terracidiphilus sp. TaxID=1964191 RepID=UPI003C27170D